MGTIRIVNPVTGKTVLREHDDGTIEFASKEMKEAFENSSENGRMPTAEELQSLIRQIEEDDEDFDGEEDEEADSTRVAEGVVPYRSGPVINGSWNASAARKRLSKWASSDNSGNKDKVNFAKYRMGFLIVEGDTKNFSSYKYPHHDVKDGSLHVHRRGVISAMAFLLKVRPSGLSSAYSHLSKHYRNDLKMDPPPLKKEAYSDDEMAKYFGEDWLSLLGQ